MKLSDLIQAWTSGMTPRLLLLACLAGCSTEGGREPTEQTPIPEIQEANQTLLGSDISSLWRVQQRNKPITIPFQSTLVTPDGRLGLSIVGSTGQWRARLTALRDPQLTVNAAGAALFSPANIESSSLETLFPRVDLLGNIPTDPWLPSGAGALSMDPRYSPSGKPLVIRNPQDCRSMTPATRDSLADPGGRYHCYRILHLHPMKTDSGNIALHQAELVVTVDANRPTVATGVTGRAANPVVVDALYLSAAFSVSRTPQGETIWALEPSATADGRLFVAQGFNAKWAFNETPWNPSSWTTPRDFNSMYNAVRTDQEGLARICRVIDAMGNKSCTPAQEEDFARVYPLAQQPLHHADGYAVGNFECGYTWITPEGTDVFCRAHPAVGLESMHALESSTAMSFLSFGQHTGWMLRRIDGGPNVRRFDNPNVDERAFSPIFLNTSTGFWAENRTDPSVATPVLRQWPVFQFVIENHGLVNRGAQYRAAGLEPTTPSSKMQYFETSFACSISPNCLLHLPMNELRQLDTWAHAPAPVTADTSNNTDFFDGSGQPLSKLNPFLGNLSSSGAQFIGDLYTAGLDERYLSGYRGTGISLHPNGSVLVNRTAGVDGTPCGRSKGCLDGEVYDQGFTAEIAFLPLVTPASSTMTIAEHYGLWKMEIENGKIKATVRFSNGTFLSWYSTASVSWSPSTAPADVQAANWTHAAIRVDRRKGTAALFVNGGQNTSMAFSPALGLVGAPQGDTLVRVGPNGACVNCASQPVLFVDELAFHKVPLRAEEIAASAGQSTPAASRFLSASNARALFASYFQVSNPRLLTLESDGFPKFVRPADLRVPSAFSPFIGNATRFRALVSAGATLFSSPVLSTGSNGQSQLQSGTGQLMSCATCHDPSKSFTDGRANALGIQLFPVNVPTIVNRAFGTSQFFARDASDLLELALRPVLEPREMNGNLTQILNRINTSPDQATLRQVLGQAFPGLASVTSTHLELALSAFQLVQLSVDSVANAITATGKPVDLQGRMLRPEQVRLGRELFEGKARCAACHTGPNLSDELMHDTGVVANTPGAFKTPTLWDVANTAPYFHDGSLNDDGTKTGLRKVLEFYNAGGPVPGRVRNGLRNIDPELRPLGLTSGELDALEVYLRTLQNAGSAYGSGLRSRFVFSDHGPVPGLFCIAIHEQDTGWENNYLCSATDHGVRYSASGPIAGMNCAQMTEASETNAAWNDNYICAPTGSSLKLRWSESGALFGKACVAFNESAESVSSWWNNHLCYDEALAVRFSAQGPIAGLNCTHMLEPSDLTHGWDDNYVCTNKDVGLRWSSSGAIAGMRCTQIVEGFEPGAASWGNNFLCVPPASDAIFSYSQAGTLAGQTCVSVNEPRDPMSWADNYLCYREEPLRLTFSPSGPITGQACVLTPEASDTHGSWGDNWLCATRDIGLSYVTAGADPNKRCTQIVEPAEPATTTWHDNYLCLPKESPIALSWFYSGQPEGRTCTLWNEPTDPHTWADDYLCYEGASARDPYVVLSATPLNAPGWDVQISASVVNGPLTSQTCTIDGSPTPCPSPTVVLGPIGDGAHTFTMVAQNAFGTHRAVHVWRGGQKAPTIRLATPSRVSGLTTCDTVPTQIDMTIENAPLVTWTCKLDGVAFSCPSPYQFTVPLDCFDHVLEVTVVNFGGSQTLRTNLGGAAVMFADMTANVPTRYGMIGRSDLVGYAWPDTWGWNSCPVGYTFIGHSFGVDGFWMCARADLANKTFYVGDVTNNNGAYYRVSGGVGTSLAGAGWNFCQEGSLMGLRFEVNGFWICMN